MRTIARMLSLVFIFFIPWEGVVELPGLGTAAKLMGFGLAAFWVATVVVTGRIRKPGLFHIAVCLFVLWIALSVFWSADPSRTLTHMRTWAQLLGMVFILWDLYTTRAALLAGLQAFILGEYVAIGIAVSNFFSGNVYYTHYQRFSPSDQTNPDGFGIIVALGIPVAWYLASSMGSAKMSGLLELLNYVYIPAAFVGIVLSGTRTAMIASMVGMAYGLASLTRLRLATRIVIFLLLILAVLYLLPQVQTLRSFERFGTTYSELTEGDLNNRTNNWAEGFDSFLEHPIVGVGANMYRSVNRLGKLAHNSFISVLVELGLIGFALFGIILTIAAIQAWRQPKWDASFWLTTLLAWAICASSLSYEFRKATWLFLTLAAVSATLTAQRDHKAVAPVGRSEPGARLLLDTRRRKWASLPLEAPPTIARQPIEFRVGTDTPAVSLNQENISITAVTLETSEVTNLAQQDASCPDETYPLCSNTECEQPNIIRFGKTRAGHQRFKCKTCGSTFTETKGTVFYRRRTPQDEILANLALLAQGNRLSSVARDKGHKKDTILDWIRDAAEHADAIEAVLSADYEIERGQLDALWAYAGIEETSEPAL